VLWWGQKGILSNLNAWSRNMWTNMRWVMEGVRQMALSGDWRGLFSILLSFVLTLRSFGG
jgi:hypothetical protein